MALLSRLLLAAHTCAFLGVSQAGAQELFGNPFATAEAVRQQRGDLPSATLRLRYEASGDPKAEQPPGEVVIDVATDWAHVRRPNAQTLYDFRAGRALELRDGGTFVSRGMLGDVVFRVLERQNRSGIARVLQGAGAKDQMDACDAETELGVAIPHLKEAADAKVKQEGATTTLECNGRVIGTFEAGAGSVAPQALWPVLAREMTMHPALQSQLVKDGRAPQHIEASFRVAGAVKALSWRLVSADPIAAPYPLAENLTNATAAWINQAVAPGLGDLAAEAVAGRALGGPPTLGRWEAQVARVAKEKGRAAAVFAMWPAFNMFPQIAQGCPSGVKSAICDQLRNLRTTAEADAAVRALLEVAGAEQRRKPAEAIPAMVAARSSPLGEHPVLLASFALALQSGGGNMQKQAEKAGLPRDAKALHVRALEAYPYNPAYWTDLGDYFVRSYDMRTAYALYDVALSLPMPDAQRANAALAGKRSFAARIRNDFPAFFLAK
jgi:hypothetical protein